ncbi:MAG: cytochrome P460 family protein [Kofleriaceae bacterium]
MRFALGLLACCGGAPTVDTTPAPDESAFAPLEVGADYASYRKLSDAPFRSTAHGDRFVEVYVNQVGAAVYLTDAEIPVGTVVVKTSWQNVDGKPSDVAGPIFVMEKRASGYDPAHADWWYAIHWAKPPAPEARKFGGPFYWRGKSPRVAYCWRCHDDYERSLGGLTPSSVLPR